MFVKGSVPYVEKMKLPNINRKSNYHIYIHKSSNVSVPITKLIITLLHVSVKRPGLCSCHSNSCMFVLKVHVNRVVTNCALLFYQC